MFVLIYSYKEEKEEKNGAVFKSFKGLKERSRIGGFGLSERKNFRQASINMNCEGALSLQLLFSLSLKALRQKEVRVK